MLSNPKRAWPMKRVLFVINTLGVGGAERALLELLDSLDSGAYAIDLHVLLPRGEMAAQVPGHVRVLNRRLDSRSVLDGAGRRALAREVLACFFRNGGWLGKLGGVLRALPDMIRRRRVQPDKLLWRVVSDGAVRPEGTYDVAVAWSEGGAAYFVADHVQAEKKLAVIHTDYEQSGYTRMLDQDCWARFQRIFLVSEEIQAPFLRVYPEHRDRVRELPNVINQGRIRRYAQEPGGFSDNYEGMRLLSVGRLIHSKAFDVAIDAMKLLKDAGYHARWYVLGEGNLRGSLERKIAALGLQEDFLLLGTVENPYPYYAQADVYVHATRFEGRSVAIQEALTLGCAVVLSDASGNRCQIDHNRDGILCALEPEAVAQAVGLLLDDPSLRKRLGAAAMEKKPPDSGVTVLLSEF